MQWSWGYLTPTQMDPEVRMKDREHGQLASLTQTRDTPVKLRMALNNKVNKILSAPGGQPGQGSTVEQEEAD
jgi:hypothetical protein